MAKDLKRSRQTISKRFKELLALSNASERAGRRDILVDMGKYYVLPCFRDFQKLDCDTVLNLFRLCGKARREELVKTYAWLLKKFEANEKEISYTDLITTFGHSKGHEETYNRFKDILTTLQGAGLIKFRTTIDTARARSGQFSKGLYIYQVNKKADTEWLDKNGY